MLFWRREMKSFFGGLICAVFVGGGCEYDGVVQ